MLLLTELLGKELKNEQTEENCGKIAAVMFDNATRRCFPLTENGFAKRCARMKLKDDALLFFADERKAEEQADSDGKTPDNTFGITLGQPVYDTNGKMLGQVTNAEISPKGVLTKLTADDASFRGGQIRCVGDIILIKVKSASQIVAEACRKNKLAAAANTQNEHMETLAPSETQPAAATPQQIARQSLIRKKYGNFNFLVGKTVDKTMTNFQGEVMIKRGETVTTDILRQAKISGKLIELYLHIE